MIGRPHVISDYMTSSRQNLLIREVYDSYAPPFSVSTAVARLIAHLNPEYMSCLSAIVLTNAADSDNLSDQARYHHDQTRGLGWIEIFVNVTLRPWPQPMLRWRFWQDLAIAEVLYHEIGHHIERLQSSANTSPEYLAVRWEKRMQKDYFASAYTHLRVLLAPLGFAVMLF